MQQIRKTQQLHSFLRRWCKPGPAELLAGEEAGRLPGSCPTQIPTSAFLPGSSSRRPRAKQAGCERGPAVQVRSAVLQPFTRLQGEVVLPGGTTRDKMRSFCSRARLRVALYPYSCSTRVFFFKSSLSFFNPFSFCSVVALLFPTAGSLHHGSCLRPCGCQCRTMPSLSSPRWFMTAPY